MSEQTTAKKVIDKGTSLLLSTISGKIGDEILEAFGDKVKLQQLEKYTEKLLRESLFPNSKNLPPEDTVNLILNYIYINTTINLKFSFQRDLSPEEEDELWDDFIVYYQNECATQPSQYFKSGLIYCINKHNKKFKELFLDGKTSFLAQLIQENNATNKNVMINMAEFRNLLVALDSKVSTESEHINAMRESLEYGLIGTKSLVIANIILVAISSGLFSAVKTGIVELTHIITKILSFSLLLSILCCSLIIIISLAELLIRKILMGLYNIRLAKIEYNQYIALTDKIALALTDKKTPDLIDDKTELIDET